MYPPKRENFLSKNQLLAQTLQRLLVLIRRCCISPHRQTEFGGTNSKFIQRYLEHCEVDVDHFDGVTLGTINAIEDLTELDISIYEIDVENDQLVAILSRSSIKKHSKSVTFLSFRITTVTRRTSMLFSIVPVVKVLTNFFTSIPLCDVICQFVMKKSKKNSQILRTNEKNSVRKTFEVWNYCS